MHAKILLTLIVCLALSTVAFAAGDLTLTDKTTSISGANGDDVSGKFNVSASGNLSSVSISSSAFGSIGSSAVSFDTNNFDVASGAKQEVTFTIAIPASTSSGTYEGTITATGSNSSNTDNFNVTLTVASTTMLAITDLDVEVDDETDKNLDDGDKISDEAKPGSEVKIDIEVENVFTTNTEIEDVELVIENDDLDLDEDFDLGDMDDGDDEKVTVEFTVPSDVDSDDYDIDITVDGRDENGLRHLLEWTIVLEVDKERNEVKIKNAHFTASKVECDPRTTTLLVEMENTGEKDQNDALIEIFSADLNLDTVFSGIVIDESEEIEKSLPIKVDDNLTAGTYPVSVKVYYDSDRDAYDDVRSVDLTVADCVEESSGSGTTATTGSGTTSTGTAGTAATTTQNEAKSSGKTTEPATAIEDVRETKSYTVILVILVVVALVVTIALLVRLISRR